MTVSINPNFTIDCLKSYSLYSVLFSDFTMLGLLHPGGGKGVLPQPFGCVMSMPCTYHLISACSCLSSACTVRSRSSPAGWCRLLQEPPLHSSRAVSFVLAHPLFSLATEEFSKEWGGERRTVNSCGTQSMASRAMSRWQTQDLF